MRIDGLPCWELLWAGSLAGHVGGVPGSVKKRTNRLAAALSHSKWERCPPLLLQGLHRKRPHPTGSPPGGRHWANREIKACALHNDAPPVSSPDARPTLGVTGAAAVRCAHHRGNRNRPPSAKANSVRFPPAAAVRRPNGPRGSPRANRRAQVELPRLATLRLPRAPPPPFPKPHRISARRPWFRRRQKCDASRIIFARTQGQSSNRWRVLF